MHIVACYFPIAKRECRERKQYVPREEESQSELVCLCIFQRIILFSLNTRQFIRPRPRHRRCRCRRYRYRRRVPVGLLIVSS